MIALKQVSKASLTVMSALMMRLTLARFLPSISLYPAARLFSMLTVALTLIRTANLMNLVMEKWQLRPLRTASAVPIAMM